MIWTPGIGDPTPMGWFTVFAYVVTAGLCIVAANSDDSRSGRNLWVTVGASFLALALNKQLDLQTLFTDFARHWAKADGWYDQRQSYQRAFIAVMSIMAITILSAATLVVRRRAWPMKAAISGLTLTCCFVIIRAASFHHIDFWLGTTVFGLRWNWLLELGGIGGVAVAAAGALWEKKRE